MAGPAMATVPPLMRLKAREKNAGISTRVSTGTVTGAVAGGAVAGAAQAALDLSSVVPIVGASGAVAACMGAFGIRFATSSAGC